MKKNVFSTSMQSLLPFAAFLALSGTSLQSATAQSLNTMSTWEFTSDKGTGHSVAQAGDMNGDGYNDLVMGNPFYSNGQTAEGKISVFYGSSTGFGSSPDWSAEGNLENANLGWTVIQAGDVNNDGYSDIVAGAPGANNSQGKVAIYYGSATGPLAAPAIINGNQTGEKFGFSIAVADINYDGYEEIYVGAPYYSSTTALGTGKVYAYGNSPSGISSQPVWNIEGNGQNAAFGWSLAIGRVSVPVGTNQPYNLIIGAPGTNDSVVAYVTLTDTLPTNPIEPPSKRFIISDNSTGSKFGYSVAIAGDINKDGFEDIIIGAPYYYNGQIKAGRATIYQGRNLIAIPIWSAQGTSENARFGWSVAGKGRINNDIHTDIGVTAPGASDNNLIIYPGTSSGLALPKYSLSSAEELSGITFFQATSTAKSGMVAGIPAITSGGLNGNGQSKFIREFEDILTRRGIAGNSTNTTALENISVYPNPAVKNLTFTINSPVLASTVNIEIINTLGVTVLSMNGLPVSTETGSITLDLPVLPQGMYYAAVHIAGQTFFQPVQINQ